MQNIYMKIKRWYFLKNPNKRGECLRQLLEEVRYEMKECDSVYPIYGNGGDIYMRKAYKNMSGLKLARVRNMQTKFAQQLLEVIRSEISKCECIYPVYGKGGWKEILLMQDVRNSGRVIGCVDGGDYLLDKNYIYNRILQETEKEDYLPKKQEYYSMLFHIGVIRPYRQFTRYYRLRSKGKYKKCFRISNAIVNYDFGKLKSH